MDYEVVGLLGRGGSAVVELAVDHDGRQVATKRLALTGSATQMRVARQRLRREAEILGRLAHPGIVAVLDLIDDGSEVVLVLPALVENLEDRVERLGPLPADEVAQMGRVLIAGLAAAHRQGIVHRDIKPANVLFDQAGRAALADFGVAITREFTAGLTLAGTVVGTPMWMAPEQARGEGAGPASDVFSLAATLAFAATGRGPYAPGPPAVVLGRAARHQILPLDPHLPRALRLPLVRMLDARPDHRPSAAGVLGGIDGTVVVPLSGTAPIPPVRLARRLLGRRILTRRILTRWSARVLAEPSVRVGKPSRRRRVGSITAVVAAIAVVGVVAFYLSQPATSGRPAAARPPAAVCTPQPYLPCGTSVPAPHTDGRICDSGWYDLDGNATDGCEAHSDFMVGTPLVQGVALHANLVPASARDSFVTHVNGDAFDLCWGTLHVTLTAPARTAEKLTLSTGGTPVATALSADGSPATATVHKPSCFGGDSEDVRVTVSALATAGGASARDFTLVRDGGW